MDDPIKKILNHVTTTKREKKVKKVHGSFTIAEDKWSAFKRHCAKHDQAYSDVVVMLIDAYLEAAEKRGELDDL